MTRDAANGQEQLPLDDAQPSDGADDAAFSGDLWDDDQSDAFGDTATTNWFSAEIENVSASDWDVDTAQIWGEDGDPAVDGATVDVDFSM